MDSRKCENWTCSGSHDQFSSTSSTELKIRIESVNQDDSHSWVRISYGTVKYVIDSIEDNTENLADPQEEQIPQSSTSVVAARSKEKAKPQPRELAGTTTIPLRERRWIDIEPSKQDLDSYDLSKNVTNLLRRNQTLHWEEDGAIEFCRIKFYLRNHHSEIRIGQMIVGKLVWPQEEDPNEDISVGLIIWEQLSTSVLFKDILVATSLILRWRTLWWL